MQFIFSARIVLVKRSLVRKPYYLQCFRHHFFKEADLGARIVREVCKFHFFDFRFYFSANMNLTTVTHFKPLVPSPESHFMSQTLVLPKEFDVICPWLAFGVPLGSLGSFLGSSLDFAGWISGLGSFLGSFLIAFGDRWERSESLG